MADSIKIRATLKGDVCTVKALIKHPMETGQRKDKKTGQLIPAHFIQEVTCSHNGKNVLDASWGAAISANPYLSIEFSAAKKGDKVVLSWVDNKGEKDSTEADIT
ncbi:MAG: thiosulfate oxidation carrier complex protein SoxZ [Thiohalomonadaceae bacterium]|jgi:sulfur-oxidizing protein SoxZ